MSLMCKVGSGGGRLCECFLLHVFRATSTIPGWSTWQASSWLETPPSTHSSLTTPSVINLPGMSSYTQQSFPGQFSQPNQKLKVSIFIIKLKLYNILDLVIKTMKL